MRKFVLPTLLLAELAFFTVLSGVSFDSFSDGVQYFQLYLADVLAQAAPIMLLAFGMTAVLMTAGIDLSVGSMTALVACVLASFPGTATFWYLALPVGLAVAVGLGLFNGLLITQLAIPPIITTLGTMIFYRGLCFVIMGDQEKAPFLDVPGYEWFGTFTGSAVLVGSLFCLGGIYFGLSRLRREVLVIGGNHIAARYAGIPVNLRVCQVYALVGFLALLAAICFTARNGSVSASSMTGLELEVIVAVVLGGTRVEGGKGSVFGTAMGVLLIAVLNEGLRGASGWGRDNLPFEISHLRFVLLGTLLMIGVWLNTHAPAIGTRIKQLGNRTTSSKTV
jgi:ribose transport system permease protein